MVWYNLRMQNKKIKFFKYVRKSLKDDDRQVVSLEAQQYDLNQIAEREKKFVYEIIEEKMTAKEPGRPLFNQMLDRIEAGEADGILVWDIERLFRNPVDEGNVRWLLQRGVLRSVRTMQREYFQCDAGLFMAIEGGRAQEHNMKFSATLIRTFETKLRHGQWPGTTFFPYLFDERTKNIYPNPETAPIVTRLFELFSEGRLGFESGAQWMASLGILSSVRTPFSKSAMQRLLTNKKLMGIMPWKGEVYEGTYKKVVSPDLFDQVQKMIKLKSKPRRTKKGHNFPFCGIFRCSCGAMMTAQWARGRLGGMYRYSRCTRKNGPCKEPYLQENKVVEQCFEALRPFALSPSEAAEIRSLIDFEEKKESGTVKAAIRKTDEALMVLDQKLRTLTRRLMDEIIDEDMYRAAKEDFLKEKIALTAEKNRLRKEACNYWIEPSLTLISTLETLDRMPDTASLHEFANIVRKIGTNPIISNKTVTFSFSQDYDFIPSLLASARVTSHGDAPKRCGDFDQNSQSAKWCARRELNPQPAASEADTLSN